MPPPLLASQLLAALVPPARGSSSSSDDACRGSRRRRSNMETLLPFAGELVTVASRPQVGGCDGLMGRLAISGGWVGSHLGGDHHKQKKGQAETMLGHCYYLDYLQQLPGLHLQRGVSARRTEKTSPLQKEALLQQRRAARHGSWLPRPAGDRVAPLHRPRSPLGCRCGALPRRTPGAPRRHAPTSPNRGRRRPDRGSSTPLCPWSCESRSPLDGSREAGSPAPSCPWSSGSREPRATVPMELQIEVDGAGKGEGLAGCRRAERPSPHDGHLLAAERKQGRKPAPLLAPSPSLAPAGLEDVVPEKLGRCPTLLADRRGAHPRALIWRHRGDGVSLWPAGGRRL
jgi:hypothetical protein